MDRKGQHSLAELSRFMDQPPMALLPSLGLLTQKGYITVSSPTHFRPNWTSIHTELNALRADLSAGSEVNPILTVRRHYDALYAKYKRLRRLPENNDYLFFKRLLATYGEMQLKEIMELFFRHSRLAKPTIADFANHCKGITAKGRPCSKCGRKELHEHCVFCGQVNHLSINCPTVN